MSKYRTREGLYEACRFGVMAAGLTLLMPSSTSGTRLPALDKSDEAICARPPMGSAVPEPEDIESHHGILDVDLAIRNVLAADGSTRFCYMLPNGGQAPTLRVKPGDLLVLRLKNKLSTFATETGKNFLSVPPDAGPMCTTKPKSLDPCTSGAMTELSTNLHFHGLTVPPLCHQDDVLKTSIQPSDGAFEYRFQIPPDEPPGLYWYHPHIHGFSSAQVSGGASGALIVEGIERANPAVLGLPERVFVIRDQKLLFPTSSAVNLPDGLPRVKFDRDGDVVNNGTGTGVPARDLSINFVPVPFPNYPPATISMKPGERQLWRVLNASAITYLDLELLFDGAPQQLGVVAIDGVSINGAKPGAPRVSGFNHLLIPPGGRAEFIATGPPIGVSGLLISRAVDTGQGGENDPTRPLASISAAADAPSSKFVLPDTFEQLLAPKYPWIGSVVPTRVRKLYFSEKLENPSDPNSATTFYITVDGQEPAVFDPASTVPNIVVKQGDVEDWIIENRTNELHDFHIHQIHFQLVEWLGSPVNEQFLRDTVNVPYFNGRGNQYPSVTLRMDFRDPNSIGTFVYHCHLLEHEDGGMMGLVRVEPRGRSDE